MAEIKAISDALIIQLATCAGLDRSRVKPFSGSVEEFVKSTSRVPFCGVVLEGVDYEEDTASVDYSIIEEHLDFKLTIIASDLRSKGYSIEDSYPLLDAVMAKVTGLDLSISGLSPWRPVSLTKHEALEAIGITVYILTITAWQTRQ